MTLTEHKFTYRKECSCDVPYKHLDRITRKDLLNEYYGTGWPLCPACRKPFVKRIITHDDVLLSGLLPAQEEAHGKPIDLKQSRSDSRDASANLRRQVSLVQAIDE